MAQEIDARFISDEWLYQKGQLKQQGVKIHQDVHIVEAAFKAQGGLIRIIARLREGRIDDVSILRRFHVAARLRVGRARTIAARSLPPRPKRSNRKSKKRIIA